jgi:hypothetical protein
VEGIAEVERWAAELKSVFARVAGRFGRADLRWRMRDHVRGLLAPVGRKNGWQLAEYVRHRDPAGLQHLLNWSHRRRHHQAIARRCHYRRRTSSGHDFSPEY